MTFHFIRHLRPISAARLRRGEFRLLSRTLRGAAAAARPLEARPRRAQRHARRGGRQDLCRAPLPGREPAADDRADRQSARRLRRAAARHRLDGRGDPRARRSPSSTRSIRGSAIRSAASTIQLDPGRPRRPARQHGPRRPSSSWNLQLSRLPNPVDRSLWAMTPQTINAYYSPLHQPDHLPGRDPAAALLRSRRRSGGQLRRDRRGDRPRDRPRLRRSGPPLRRAAAGSATGGRRRPAERFTERTDAARRAI